MLRATPKLQRELQALQFETSMNQSTGTLALQLMLATRDIKRSLSRLSATAGMPPSLQLPRAARLTTSSNHINAAEIF